MLQQWESSYMEVRAKIEASGRDQRWEFNKNDLFKDTKHMAEICQNLYDVAQVCYRKCMRACIKKLVMKGHDTFSLVNVSFICALS